MYFLLDDLVLVRVAARHLVVAGLRCSSRWPRPLKPSIIVRVRSLEDCRRIAAKFSGELSVAVSPCRWSWMRVAGSFVAWRASGEAVEGGSFTTSDFPFMAPSLEGEPPELFELPLERSRSSHASSVERRDSVMVPTFVRQETLDLLKNHGGDLTR